MMQSPSSKISNPPLIHLGALTYVHNRIPYTIRARVSFDFRDDAGTLLRLRLQAVPAPPTSIDLNLHGRWKTVLSAVKKQQLLQISGASVRRSQDPDINNLQLELQDDIGAEKATISLLDDSARPVSIVQGSQLDRGAYPVENSTPAPPPTWASPAALNGNRSRPRIQMAAAGSEHTYTPIADIYDNLEAYTKKKINIYGVVVDARAPCTTRGPDLRGEIVVADESSIRDMRDGQALKTIAIYCFERDPAHCIPYRSVGDVVRCHRILTGKYQDQYSDIPRLQGVARFYTTLLLWAHDSTKFEPFGGREAVPIKGRRETITHIITPQDHDRITSLRRFAMEYLFSRHKMYRPFVRTVLEVNNADDCAEFLGKSFDLVCRFEREEPDANNPDKLQFLVSDGLLNNGKGGQSLKVESNVSFDQSHFADGKHEKFEEFCPSWSIHPRDKPSWLMIRDVSVKIVNGERRILLGVSRKTSTLVWQSENAPDVRVIRAMYQSATATSMPHPMTVMRPSSAPGPQPAQYRNAVTERDAAELNNRSISDAEVQPISVKQNSYNMRSTKRQYPNDSRSDDTDPLNGQGAGDAMQGHEGNHSRQSEAGQRSPKKRKRVGDGEQPLGVVDESRIETFRSNTGILVKLISKHDFISLPISSLDDIKRCVAKQNLGIHRVRFGVRACITPRDLRFACKPWCSKCGVFLKIHVTDGALDCFRCSDSFDNVGDPRTKWAYSVKILLEDEAGRKIEAVIAGNEGTKFFTGLPATNLLGNIQARQKVSNYLQLVLDPENRLDCAIKPYEYMDSNGIYQIACQIVDTHLLERFVPKNGKQ